MLRCLLTVIGDDGPDPQLRLTPTFTPKTEPQRASRPRSRCMSTQHQLGALQRYLLEPTIAVRGRATHDSELSPGDQVEAVVNEVPVTLSVAYVAPERSAVTLSRVVAGRHDGTLAQTTPLRTSPVSSTLAGMAWCPSRSPAPSQTRDRPGRWPVGSSRAPDVSAPLPLAGRCLVRLCGVATVNVQPSWLDLP
jgi:hypothetical protein